MAKFGYTNLLKVASRIEINIIQVLMGIRYNFNHFILIIHQ